MYQYIQGVLMFSRLSGRLEWVESDLREGIYRLLDLKDADRRQPASPHNTVA